LYQTFFGLILHGNKRSILCSELPWIEKRTLIILGS